MTTATEQLHFYLSALDSAAHAIEQARRVRPDPGLDHAIDRLRSLLLDGYRVLQQRESGGGLRRPAASATNRPKSLT
ncbi:MAG: hypothetical protein IPO66_21680 [Rhodanobacteraceae bacterium]|nr:hypothetical protein [Rhodanobacteraceae bacterium]